MEPEIVAGMVFSITVLVLIGGFVLLYPLSRQLGKYLEKRMLPEGSADAAAAELSALTRSVEGLRQEVERISERQDFTERLLDEPSAPGAEG